MRREEFETLVAETLNTLPAFFRDHLDNIEVIVETAPSPEQCRQVGLQPDETLFGLYEGVPLTNRTTHYSLVLPDRITIFQRPIEHACRTKQEIRAQVRRTVIHEIAHHFGIDDDRLRELNAYE